MSTRSKLKHVEALTKKDVRKTRNWSASKTTPILTQIMNNVTSSKFNEVQNDIRILHELLNKCNVDHLEDKKVLNKIKQHYESLTDTDN